MSPDCARQIISIHTPLAGSDSTGRRPVGRMSHFNPHSPCGERPCRKRAEWPRCYFNPHSPCGERPARRNDIARSNHISIHTPLAGSDRNPGPDLRREPISIHTPLAGSDLVSSLPSFELVQFQSTLPLRGATWFDNWPQFSIVFQSTLPLRGATWWVDLEQAARLLFQSTLPLRGATAYGCATWAQQVISIHTPLAGSDEHVIRVASPFAGISIHTPLAGSDTAFHADRTALENFNPHSPCGERPQK